MGFSGYRFVWVLTLFDLPTDTALERKRYAQFRKFLIKNGFDMMQYSVYMRYCSSYENATVHIQRVSEKVPPDGEVRIIVITDKQFERMHIFQGKMRKPPEKAPRQLELF